MARRKKEYEVFEVGQHVKIKRPAVWYANGVNGLTENVVVHDIGATGHISYVSSFPNCYTVEFDGGGMPFQFHAASLEPA